MESRPKAKLLYVGDFEYKAALEELASKSTASDRIIFTGALPRESLGTVYGATSVFVFPSLTDTQGLVIHEAALAGCPIVLIDKGVSEVVEDGVNGYIADSSEDMASKVVAILSDKKLRLTFGQASKKLAGRYTEVKQTKKLETLYIDAIASHTEKRRSSMQKIYRHILAMRRKIAKRMSSEL